MPLSTNLNVAPFYDTGESEITKNYQKILFRPRTVQARELNALQTLQQNQIELFGRNIFKEGSVVIPGGINTNLKQPSIGITFTSGALTDIKAQTTDVYVKSNTTGLTAKIKKIIDPALTDPAYFFIDNVNSGTSNTVTTFTVGDTLNAFVYNADGSTRQIAALTISNVSTGQWVQILAGTYFVHGYFVSTTDQSVVVSKNSTTTTAKVGFIVSESIVNEIQDNSLYSNAFGTPNFKAPGAARLQMALNLVLKLPADKDDINFVELVSIENGTLQSLVDTSQYALINDAIAKRTFETNGNYTVIPFGIDIKEHLLDTTRTEYANGLFTAVQGGDATKFVTQIKSGVGYVNGYRIENISNINIVEPKARTTTTAINAVTSSDYGNYILVNALHSIPVINIRDQFTFKDSGGTSIGTTRVLAMRKHDGTNYRLYLFDTAFNTGKTLANAVTINYSDSSNQFYATLTQNVVFNASATSLVFPLPYSNVATLIPNGTLETSYTVLREFNVTTDASGNASISANTNEVFAPIDSSTYFIGLTGATNTGTVIDPTGKLTMTGSPIGRSMSIALTVTYANSNIKIIAPIIKQQPTQKTKTLTTFTETITFSNATQMPLSNADVYKIVSITDTSTNVDVTANYVLDNGQRLNWYEVGKLNTTSGSPSTRTLSVTYKYFVHSTGDYCSIDSYAGMAREDISTITINGATISLADVIDFRPIKNASGNITSSTFYGEIAEPVNIITAGIVYYLPRIDSIYVDKDGNFGAITGVPSTTPSAPTVPAGTMKLYEVSVPAYTANISSIVKTMIENKRYTMRDIGALENRISTVEYYTALNMLEQSANNIQVIDPTTGNNRFKNGFATDNFSDLSLADINNKEWAAAFDFNNHMILPRTIPNAIDLSQLSAANGALKTNYYLPAYTEVIETTQPYASTTSNINPYAVYTWNGDLTLSPASDYWVDTKNVSGSSSTSTSAVNNSSTVNSSAFNVYFGAQGSTASAANYGGAYTADQWIANKGVGSYSYLTTKDGSWVTSSTSSSSHVVASTQTYTTLVSSQIIPKMRTVAIKFTGNNFKPYSNMYPFFGDVNVAAYCTPTGGTLGQQLTTDAHGYVSGIFQVPNSATMSFNTGKDTFRLTTMSDNSIPADGDYSYADSVFTSGGTLNTYAVNTVTTYTTVTDTVTTNTNNYMDPIAQSFMVSEDGGCYVSKVDLFFATKAQSIPVRIQIRTVENGFPTTQMVKGATKTLTPDLVNVSTDGTVATSFVFDDPVFLKDGLEYAIVVLANTQEYNVYISQMGQVALNQQVAISKQPATGVFFTSSNASTWTPNQLQDLKFNIWRAKFDPTTPAVFEFQSNAPVAVPLGYNALSSVSGSPTITMKLESHGLHAGDTFTLAGVNADNGFTSTQLNAVQTAITTTIDTVTFTASSNATYTGTFGGTTMTAVGAFPFNYFQTYFQSIVLPNTNINWEYKYKGQNSRSIGSYTAFNPNINNYLGSEGVVINQGDFCVRATLTTTADNIAPAICKAPMTIPLFTSRINNDSSNAVYQYVTQPIKFNNPSTSAKFFVSAIIPSGNIMNVYYKPLMTADDVPSALSWTQINPVAPITNSNVYTEYEYDLSGIGSFIGYVVKIQFLGTDATNTPAMNSFMSIALA